MKSMERNFVLIPPGLLAELLFDFANYPSFSHEGDRFQVKRRVSLTTGERDAYNFLFTKNVHDDEPGSDDDDEGCSGPPPPPAPDFNGETVATHASSTAAGAGGGGKRRRKPNRETEGGYKRLYTEVLYTDAEGKSVRSHLTEESQMQWQLNCILSMKSSPPPKDADKRSVENSIARPVHRRATRYDYKMVKMKDVLLTRVDRGWIGFEAHLVATEEVIRGFMPLSHRINGIHSVPRLHLTTRNADMQARKKLKKGHAFMGGAYAHGLRVTLNVSINTSPQSVLPVISRPKISSEAVQALSSSRWGQIWWLSYLHGLGATGSVMPWQIHSWLLEKAKDRELGVTGSAHAPGRGAGLA